MKASLFCRLSAKTTVACASVLACATAGLISLNAADEKKPAAGGPDDATLKAAMEAMTPGAPHKFLEGFIGEWEVHTKMWMQPGADPMESDGTASAKWILGKRFVETTIKSTMMGQPFEGRSISGYDNLKKVYTSFWIDNMGTAMTTTTGKLGDDGKTLTSKGKMDDPWSGKMNQEYKFVDRLGKDEITSEIYTVADGKETKMMEMTSKRKK
ncbi:MAG TPA: DUF1579 domain-containing protein [Verrucomicrobiales bacterium]|jgi:hypothetical protein|nr:DUF1579 domain-containing protein [Verrucomicrobiales bacterium]